MSLVSSVKSKSSDETKPQRNTITDIIDEGRKLQWFNRENLPVNQSATDFSVWNFVKQCIGKDLTHISMPVTLNEPISFLQRVAEYLEYSELITEAVKQSDPVRRMEYVCAFALSTTSSNVNRVRKPFNPLLGETYELHRDGFVFVAEQVSHHPPITAFHAESPDFRLWATVQFRLRFWGKSIEVLPKGVVTLELLRPQVERYTWQNANLVVHNVLMGKLWIELTGSLQVIGHSTGLQADLEFQSANWLFSQSAANQVTGRLTPATGQPRPTNKLLEGTAALLKNTVLALDLASSIQLPSGSSAARGPVHRVLFGNSTRGLFSVDLHTWEERPKGFELPAMNPISTSGGTTSPTNNTSEENSFQPPANNPEFGFERPLANQRCLWMARSGSSGSPNQYNFSSFTVGLNELTGELMNAKAPVTAASSSYLPPTDCRFRPDIRALENGDLDLASSEKNRLEEKQRYVRRRLSQQQQQTKNSIRRNANRSSTVSSPATSPTMEAVSPPPSPADVRAGPLWFRQAQPDDDWLFTGLYWQRDWSNCPDLY